jgi:hypothetical protein
VEHKRNYGIWGHLLVGEYILLSNLFKSKSHKFRYKLSKRCFVWDAGAPNDIFTPRRHQCVAYLVETGAEFVGGVSVVGGWKGWWMKNEKVSEHIPPGFRWDGTDQYGQEYAILAGS